MEKLQTDLVVIGAGPGGYAAAFYAAASGKKVILVEQEKRFGGVCLNRGCIPSKALLHLAKLIHETAEVGKCGLAFGKPVIHLDQMRAWKDSVLEKLGQGIASLAGRRGVQVITGHAQFEGSKSLRVETSDGGKLIEFGQAVIATGSRAALPAVFDIRDPRVMTSTEALELMDIPKKLLVVGGGYIGMELGTVYAALGSAVTVAEAMDGILLGADADLVRLVQERAAKIFKEIRLGAKVEVLNPLAKGIEVRMIVGGVEKREVYDRVLVSIGRTPNTQGLGLETTKIQRDAKGFIQVDQAQRTAEPSIYAIGDVTGGMMLAHKASKDAKVAVNAVLGKEQPAHEPLIPAVVFTDPELAWCGLTETEAKAKNIPVQIVKFPWAACGRALTLERTDGATKLLIDAATEKILGVGICGVGAGELISDGLRAVEMGLKARYLARIVHPHPTLSETLMEAAEMFYGHATHAFSRKR